MEESILDAHADAKTEYSAGGSPLGLIEEVTKLCLEQLDGITREPFGHRTRTTYFCYSDGKKLSRPIRSDLLIDDPDEFGEQWNAFIASIDRKTLSSSIESDAANRLLYTAVMAFAAAIDLWKSRSRKMPGTHFEVVLGSVLSQYLPTHERSKFVLLPGEEFNVSTDIAFVGPHGGLVIPAKITTRERIVQPYAHQRILDAVLGEGKYKSVLVSVSETQRKDSDRTVNEICVPGTIKAYQAHLAKLSGIYYCDPPARYLDSDIDNLVPVRTVGQLLTGDLSGVIGFTQIASSGEGEETPN